MGRLSSTPPRFQVPELGRPLGSHVFLSNRDLRAHWFLKTLRLLNPRSHPLFCINLIPRGYAVGIQLVQDGRT